MVRKGRDDAWVKDLCQDKGIFWINGFYLQDSPFPLTIKLQRFYCEGPFPGPLWIMMLSICHLSFVFIALRDLRLAYCICP